MNYKITILIQSELKSEIEKLRWITTRRGLIAIASLACGFPLLPLPPLVIGLV